MTQRVDSGERQGYATALAGLWPELARTLGRLEQLAARPEETLAADEAGYELGRLRYTLHVTGERIYGLVPPPGTEATHEELALAIAEARDATAEVAEAVEEAGAEAAAPLVPEWRGALFRVRLARLRLSPPRRRPADAEAGERPGIATPLAALVLVVLGAAAFVVGATRASWEIWALGIAAVAAGLLVYRP